MLYLQGTIDVLEAGAVRLQLKTTEPIQAWLDVTPVSLQEPFVTELEKGIHTLTLRVTPGDTPSSELKAEFSKPEGSAAQFMVP